MSSSKYAIKIVRVNEKANVVSREKILHFQRQIRITDLEMVGSAIYRKRLKSDFCLCNWVSLLRRRPLLPQTLPTLGLSLTSGISLQRQEFHFIMDP